MNAHRAPATSLLPRLVVLLVAVSGVTGLLVKRARESSEPTRATRPLPLQPEGPPAEARPSPEPERAQEGQPQRIAFTQPLADFRSRCWESPSEPALLYAGQPLAKFSVFITASETAPRTFDFCVTALAFDRKSVHWGEHGLMPPGEGRYGRHAGWFPYSDTVTTWMQPPGGRSFWRQVAPRGPVCATGTVAQVIDGDYATTWGAALGFAFLQPGPGIDRDSLYRPDFRTVTVVLAGNDIPEGLRFVVDDDLNDGAETSWCVTVR